LVKQTVLVIHLGAIGAVLRSSALLAPIRKKYRQAQITWVTDKPADQLLKNHPEIDRVITTEGADLITLRALKFDVAFVIDKSLKAAGVLAMTQAREVFGFKADAMTGSILPATFAAKELWELGLSNQKKFFENQKSELLLMTEALELGDKISDYNLPLSEIETKAAHLRNEQWTLNPEQPVIGINTGCSAVIPYKKLSISGTRQLISKLIENGFENLVLLGGPEDSERNREIGQGLAVIQSPTDRGLRDGLVSVAACDVVFTGDSLGMHMAISQKKYVLAWFGPTCAQEIELFGRGEKILTTAPCAPCWKRSCEQSRMCYDQVDFNLIAKRIGEFVTTWQPKSSSIKLPFSEISS
jgi:heptosyltransferase-2